MAASADGAELKPVEDGDKAETPRKDWIWTIYVPVVALLLVIFCAGLLMYHGWTQFVDLLFETVEASEHRVMQAFVINSVLVIMTVCCLPGPSFCVILDGFFFGFVKGFALGFVAELIGYLLCILLARTCFRTTLREWLKEDAEAREWCGCDCRPTLRETVLVCEKDKTGKFLVLFRFISLPVWAKNYAIGMLDFQMEPVYLEWLKAVLIFIPAETFYAGIFAYIGSKGYIIADAIRKGDTQKALDSFSGFEVAIVAVSMLCMTFLIIFGWQEYSRRRGDLAEGSRSESIPLAVKEGQA